MNGTALLINDDYTVKVLENVKKEQANEMKKAKSTKQVSVIYHEAAIDWEYGY